MGIKQFKKPIIIIIKRKQQRKIISDWTVENNRSRLSHLKIYETRRG